MKNYQKHMLDQFDEIYEVAITIEMISGHTTIEATNIAMRLFEIGNTSSGLYKTPEMLDEVKKRK